MKLYASSFLASIFISSALLQATGLGQEKSQTDASIELDGIWHVEAETDSGSRELTWTVESVKGKTRLTSVDQQSGDEREFDRIDVTGKSVKMEMDIEQNGNEGIIRVEAKEKILGKLQGKWSILSKDGTEYMSGDIWAQKEVPFAGEWEAISVLPDGNELESMVAISGKNSNLKGKLTGANGEIDIDKFKAKPRSLEFEFEFEMNGQSIEVTIEAKAEGDNKLVGEWIVPRDEGDVSGKWTAKRKAPSFAGTWNVLAAVPNADEYRGTLTLDLKGKKYSGKSVNSNGEGRKLDTVKINGKNVMFEVPFEQGGNMGTITVEARVQKDGSLKGTWKLVGDDGQEYASDDWSATREK